MSLLPRKQHKWLLKTKLLFHVFMSGDAFLKLNMNICVLSELSGAHPKAMKISGNIWNMPETLEASLYSW